VHDSEWGIGCTRYAFRRSNRRLCATSADAGGDRPFLGLRAEQDQRGERSEEIGQVEAGIHGCAVEDPFHEVGPPTPWWTWWDVRARGGVGYREGIRRHDPVGGGTVEIMHGAWGAPRPRPRFWRDTRWSAAGDAGADTPRERSWSESFGLSRGACRLSSCALWATAEGPEAGAGPNVLRAIIGEAGGPSATADHDVRETVVELQTNIDDLSPK